MTARAFTYMADNRLERVGGAEAAYYDGLKRLYWVNEPISFAYDGDRMIA
jgi:hypothetical protein